MSDIAVKVVLKGLIDGVINELLVKTTGDQVWLNDTTTLSDKMAELVEAVNARAKTTDMNSAISALRKEILGDTPVEAYNTFTELAAYIDTHQDAADALTAAIGNKADASTVNGLKATISSLGSLATKSTVSESDLDTALKEKVNAASSGNHSHSNKTTLDNITDTKVAAWDSKATVYVTEEQPANLASDDLWFQIITE